MLLVLFVCVCDGVCDDVVSVCGVAHGAERWQGYGL